MPTLEEAKARFKLSWERVRAASHQKEQQQLSKPMLREWRVTLIRYRGEFLGNVKATSREAAESEAAKLFSLSDFHRRRLLLEERL